MYYFAYGSNLDLLQMQLRCPDAQFVSTAKLDGYRVCFPRRSVIRDCAVISIEPSMSESVWGALYELDGTDIQRLDEREGYDKRRDRALNQFNRITVRVETADERAVVAEVYVAVPTANPGLPSPQYVGYLVASAAECGLPKSHLVKLAQHMPVPQAA
ncbi:MAG: gamma-glutamylcyclotransferase family protein [Bauldia sp.]